MVKHTASVLRSKRGHETAASGVIRQRIKPAVFVLALCMPAIYQVMNHISRSLEVGDNSLRKAEDLIRQDAQTGGEAVATSSTPTTVPGCTTLQKRLTQKALPDAVAIIHATKCPNSSAWLSNYLEEASDEEAFLFLNFGCNKGYDSVFVAETVSRNSQVFNKGKWADAIGIGQRGACNQGLVQGNPPPLDASLPIRPVEVHCIEAMPQTVERLIRAAEVTTAQANGFHAYNYAMTGVAGGAPILFPNPKGEAGIERLGIQQCNDPDMRPQCTEVPTKTVDEFVRDHVDSIKANRRIPYVSIDVEGFDFTVLQGATETLKRVDYLEFEYHTIGDWGQQKLEDAMNMLQLNGFVCYWAGVNQLWRLSGTCWMDLFEFHQWSNVACVNTETQPKLAEKMEQVFEDTLVQGNATFT